MARTRFAGQIALITGGAQGIGLEMAYLLGKQGARIILADIQKDKVSTAVRALQEKGITAFGYELDVTKGTSVRQLAEAVHKDVGPITMLINNAGIIHGGSFLSTPLSRHLATYDVNVNGVVRVTHAFLRDVMDAPVGYVVNIASASGLIGLPYGTTYGSSKWAVIGFSESLRLELELEGCKNVSVTTVCPSYISTGMFDGAEAPRLTRILTPGKIAKIIVDATWKKEVFVLEPFLVKLIPGLRGVLPPKVWDIVARLFKVNTSMMNWQGRR